MFNLHGKAGGNILGLMFRSASLSLVPGDLRSELELSHRWKALRSQVWVITTILLFKNSIDKKKYTILKASLKS